VPFDDRDHPGWWDAYGEAGIEEGHCAAVHGAGGAIASIHLGFDNRKLDSTEQTAIDLALSLVVERIREISPLMALAETPLTVRERDCMGFVAAGKTDWEISVILGVSERTVRFHVENARGKLGAVNRTQAVAKLVARGDI
jgi:LuxR family transcriptional regulator, quorum-sensing system regulator BjaR1